MNPLKPTTLSRPASAAARRRPIRRRAPRRHGLSSLMAMLFLVLFSTLAVGFYTASGTSSQIAGNNRSLSLAQAAAEAGTQFVRYRLFKMTLAPTIPQAGLLDAVATDLAGQLNGTAVMDGG